MSENRTRYAVLGALTVEPMSGYDLKRFFAQGVSFFWTESYGQIYPILKQLRAEGLVADAVGPPDAAGPADARRSAGTPGHPRRAVYAITPAGREALAHWLAEPAEPQVGRRLEILLKLFFARQGGAGGGEAARRLVADFRAHHSALLATYAATGARLRADHAAHPDLPFWLLTLSYGEHVSQALVAWCDAAARTLVAPPAPPAPPAPSAGDP
jgi:DNA-binding PadR family transcriptional regulator